LIFDHAETLIYVGTACASFAKRVWGHHGVEIRRYTDIVPFPDKQWFFAPALEAFLIARLRPRDNTEYRGYSS